MKSVIDGLPRRVGFIYSTEQALKIVVSLSRPGKMPCLGYSIPASRCIAGSQLAKQPGTICNECYALRGWYPKREEFLEERLKALSNPEWVDAMIFLIRSQEMPYFRWHDSGDLQGLWHLQKIVAVAIGTPECKHWLPTREYGMIREYVEGGGKFPDNLIVRLSATMFDGELPIKLAKRLGVQVSGVSAENYDCPAYSGTPEHSYIDHDNVIPGACGNCRKCWSKDVFSVIYKRH